jgi:hypothetical protein
MKFTYSELELLALALEHFTAEKLEEYDPESRKEIIKEIESIVAKIEVLQVTAQ